MAAHRIDTTDGILITLSLSELLTAGVAQAINAGIDHETIRGTFIAIAHDDDFWRVTGRVQADAEESAEKTLDGIGGDLNAVPSN